MSFFRKPTKFEWISLIIVLALFIWFLVTKSDRARYLILAVVTFYFFVGRIIFGSNNREK